MSYIPTSKFPLGKMNHRARVQDSGHVPLLCPGLWYGFKCPSNNQTIVRGLRMHPHTHTKKMLDHFYAAIPPLNTLILNFPQKRNPWSETARSLLAARHPIPGKYLYSLCGWLIQLLRYLFTDSFLLWNRFLLRFQNQKESLTSQYSVIMQNLSCSTKFAWNLTIAGWFSLERSWASKVACTVSFGLSSPIQISFSTFLQPKKKIFFKHI